MTERPPKQRLKDRLETCEHCGQQFSMRGLPRHRQACARAHAGTDTEVNPPAENAAPAPEETTPNETLTRTLPVLTIPALLQEPQTAELIDNTIKQGSEIIGTIETAAGNQIEIVRSAAAATPAKVPGLKDLATADLGNILQMPGVPEKVPDALAMMTRLGNAIAERIENGSAKKQQVIDNRPNEVNF